MQERDIYLHTVSGKKIYPLDIRSSEFDIEDMAHSLARITRYCGHVRTRGIYSVAQHSVLVANYLKRQPIGQKLPAIPLAGLLHDTPEYILCDVPGPIKAAMRELGGTAYDELEHGFEDALEDFFFLPRGIFAHTAVIEADRSIRRNEVIAFRQEGHLCESTDQQSTYTALNIEPIVEWSVEMAQFQFLQTYNTLVGKVASV